MDRLYEVRGPCNLSFVTVARVVTFDRVSNENLFRGIFNFPCFIIFLFVIISFLQFISGRREDVVNDRTSGQGRKRLESLDRFVFSFTCCCYLTRISISVRETTYDFRLCDVKMGI